jgi:hypothetical protein
MEINAKIEELRMMSPTTLWRKGLAVGQSFINAYGMKGLVVDAQHAVMVCTACNEAAKTKHGSPLKGRGDWFHTKCCTRGASHVEQAVEQVEVSDPQVMALREEIRRIREEKARAAREEATRLLLEQLRAELVELKK